MNVSSSMNRKHDEVGSCDHHMVFMHQFRAQTTVVFFFVSFNGFQGENDGDTCYLRVK